LPIDCRPPPSPENAPLGVNIVQDTDISQDSVCELNQRRFRSAMNDSMLDLDGLSPVSGKAVFARFDGGQLQTVFTQKRLFGRPEGWHPCIMIKDREFVWRVGSEGFRASRIRLAA
jgi:hypothetical protein